ncbi:hypothetical protein N7463_009360 [Penicillium fimorum]|uniref:Uncharacterized protein n=1 Tax=Penicillium fimorum TaxID=1882269 RepID=A0A9W9XQL8_9EURO|nr:hypothetical protein N7463_009360 [Penicillium fimorum]
MTGLHSADLSLAQSVAWTVKLDGWYVADGVTCIYNAVREPGAAFADWIETGSGVFGAVLPGAGLRIQLR